MSADYYRKIARVLEEGKFHLGFFDDRLAMPERYGNDHRHTVEHGIRCVKMDPIAVLMVMGMVTNRLGLGATCSTTYYEPFHVARTVRHARSHDKRPGSLERRDIAERWRGDEHGPRRVLEHDLRYDRADEFMEIVLGHWNAWADDALVVDKSRGFAHPDKVRRLDYEGR